MKIKTRNPSKFSQNILQMLKLSDRWMKFSEIYYLYEYFYRDKKTYEQTINRVYQLWKFGYLERKLVERKYQYKFKEANND